MQIYLVRFDFQEAIWIPQTKRKLQLGDYKDWPQVLFTAGIKGNCPFVSSSIGSVMPENVLTHTVGHTRARPPAPARSLDRPLAPVRTWLRM